MKGPSPSPPRRTLGTSDNRRLAPFAHPGSPTVRLLGRSMDSQASHRCRSCLIPFSAPCVLISRSGAKVNFDLQMFDFLPKDLIHPSCACCNYRASGRSSRLHMSDAYLAILSNVSVLTSFLIIEEASETIVNSFSNRARHDFTPCIVREASPDDQQDIKKC